jgi:hypothetical protein
MNRQVSFAIGMSCLIATAVLGYVAYDSYQTNAERGQAARTVLQDPLVRLLPGVKELQPKLEPTTPTTTKVCGAIGAGTGVTGLMFLFLAMTGPKHPRIT